MFISEVMLLTVALEDYCLQISAVGILNLCAL